MDDIGSQQQDRNSKIVRTSVIGIVVNVLLATFKAIVGILSNSIAVTLDAVNNLSDALSSVVTIIGTKLAGKKPDKKHPLGYGRIEYLTTMIIAAIVLYAGITALTESVGKIIDPEVPDYSTVSLIVIASAVLVKIFLGRYVKGVGEKVNSGSLVASGKDALFDAVLSASVLLSAIIFVVWGISLEAYVGLLISVFIIKASIEMFSEAVDEILGRRTDKEEMDAIKDSIMKEEKVTGVYDLIIHSYGPNTTLASVHVEVPSDMDAKEIDRLERSLATRIYQEFGIILTATGIYAIDTDEESTRIRNDVKDRVMNHEGVLQVHGFFLDREAHRMDLDVIIDFDMKDREAVYCDILKDIESAYPDYKVAVVLDIDL